MIIIRAGQKKYNYFIDYFYLCRRFFTQLKSMLVMILIPE